MSYQRSYFPSYFSIEDILATQEKLPCKFKVDVPKLGCLNPSSETGDLKAGSKLDLPMWLVESIALNRSAIATADIPRIYKEAYREILKADACAVDLHKLGMYFYEFGNYVARFDERRDVSDILVETFKTRFRQVMDLAQNSGPDPSVVNRLEMLERSIFHAAHKSQVLLDNWLVHSRTAIEAAEMVTNHKKRKLAEIDDL